MSAEHFGRFSRDRFYFEADFLSLPGRRHVLVIALDTGHHTDLQELTRKKEKQELKYNLPLFSSSTRITSLDGTQSGVPSRTIPASIMHPATIGSLELNTKLGSILILQGKTARCLNSSRLRRFSSSWYSVNRSNKWYMMSACKDDHDFLVNPLKSFDVQTTNDFSMCIPGRF